MRTILLLTISNIFMTIAWYGTEIRSEALWKVIMVSGGSLLRILFQVPANRIGSTNSPRALKTIQEIITLSISRFLRGVSRRQFKWNYGVGFAFIVIAAFFIFHKW